jgi:hypothetical protein
MNDGEMKLGKRVPRKKWMTGRGASPVRQQANMDKQLMIRRRRKFKERWITKCENNSS